MDGTMEIIQRAFQIEQKDNVATALEGLMPGALWAMDAGRKPRLFRRYQKAIKSLFKT